MTRSWKWFCGAALASLALDLATKALVEARIEPYGRVVVIDGLLNLTNVRNPGAAFGMLSSGGFGRIAFFAAVGLLAMGFILWLVKKNDPQNRFEPLCFGLVFGGAVGNLVDRIRYGEVVDFIDAFIGTRHWPAFNVADAAIVVGVFGWMAVELFVKKKEREPAE